MRDPIDSDNESKEVLEIISLVHTNEPPWINRGTPGGKARAASIRHTTLYLRSPSTGHDGRTIRRWNDRTIEVATI
jgi:hypothetical protein